jgi:hypothetical protein
VWNIKMKINEHAWKLHPNVVASLDLWREAHAEEVFLYQAQETAVGPNGKLVVRRALHNRLAQQPRRRPFARCRLLHL